VLKVGNHLGGRYHPALREPDIGTQQIRDQLVAGEETFIGAQRKFGTVVRPVDLHTRMGAVQAVHSPDALFGQPNDARHIEVHHRRSRLEVQPFSHRI
jgi:hypothetical protein